MTARQRCEPEASVHRSLVSFGPPRAGRGGCKRWTMQQRARPLLKSLRLTSDRTDKVVGFDRDADNCVRYLPTGQCRLSAAPVPATGGDAPRHTGCWIARTGDDFVTARCGNSAPSGPAVASAGNGHVGLDLPDDRARLKTCTSSITPRKLKSTGEPAAADVRVQRAVGLGRRDRPEEAPLLSAPLR